MAFALALQWPLYLQNNDYAYYLIGYYYWAGSMALLALLSFGYAVWLRAATRQGAAAGVGRTTTASPGRPLRDVRSGG